MERTGKKRKLEDSFSDAILYVMPTGIGKARCEVFRKQVTTLGGTVKDSYIPGDTDFVVVDEKMELDRFCRILKLDQPPSPQECKIVKSLWLSACLKQKQLLPTEPYELDVEAYLGKTVKHDTEKISPSSPSTSTDNVPKLKEDPEVQPSTSDGVNAKLPVTDTLQGKVEDPLQPVSHHPDNTDAKSKFPKVGVMFRSYKKAKVSSEEEDSDVESDYLPSGDDDGSGDSSGENHQVSGAGNSPSPQKKPLPVGLLL